MDIHLIDKLKDRTTCIVFKSRVFFVNSVMKVDSVRYVSGYVIHVTFDDGTEGDVDLSELVKKGIFRVLEDKAVFSKVHFTDHCIAWSDELEIDPYTIYQDITGKLVDEIS